MLKNEQDCSYNGGEVSRPLRSWSDFSTGQYPNFESLRITHSYKISTRLLRALRPQGSNGTPAARRIRPEIATLNAKGQRWRLSNTKLASKRIDIFALAERKVNCPLVTSYLKTN